MVEVFPVRLNSVSLWSGKFNREFCHRLFFLLIVALTPQCRYDKNGKTLELGTPYGSLWPRRSSTLRFCPYNLRCFLNSIPLRDRLIEFYRQYSDATYRPDWLRIYLYAGLSGPVLNRRYIKLLQRELLPVYCREVRTYCGVDSPDLPVSSEEIEFIWSLHGGIFYYAVRQHVYLLKMDADFMFKVEYAVDNFLAGAKTVYPKLLATIAGNAKVPPQKGKGSRAG